ncbi:hypothetical protein LguiA_029820 [Lonicera macranthoides]
MFSNATQYSWSEILLYDLQLFFFIGPLGHLGGHLSLACDEIAEAFFLTLLGHFQVFTGNFQILVGPVFGHELLDDISPSFCVVSLQIEKPSQGGPHESHVKGLSQLRLSTTGHLHRSDVGLEMSFRGCGSCEFGDGREFESLR